MNIRVFSCQELIEWFAVEKRAFPWREERTPYRVLVSEVMLQQTQAERVVGYFLHWMQKFPTIFSLASAAEEELIKAWEGLGYYSRARSLHRCAKIICEKYGGLVPEIVEELQKLPGIGPYTAGAIVSFAFNGRAEAIDANVRRVICRLIKGCFENGVLGEVNKILPEKEPYVAMESLIELGALICSKVPKCERCPCRDQCYAYTTGCIKEVTKQSKATRIALWRDVGIFKCQDFVLIKKPPEKGLMSGLYEFPYLEGRKGGRDIEAVLEEFCIFSGSMKESCRLAFVKHSFTKYCATLYPVVIKCEDFFDCIKDTQWVKISQLARLPFSAGHKKILKGFLSL